MKCSSKPTKTTEKQQERVRWAAFIALCDRVADIDDAVADAAEQAESLASEVLEGWIGPVAVTFEERALIMVQVASTMLENARFKLDCRQRTKKAA